MADFYFDTESAEHGRERFGPFSTINGALDGKERMQGGDIVRTYSAVYDVAVASPLAGWQRDNCVGCGYADAELVGTGEPCCDRAWQACPKQGTDHDRRNDEAAAKWRAEVDSRTIMVCPDPSTCGVKGYCGHEKAHAYGPSCANGCKDAGPCEPFTEAAAQ